MNEITNVHTITTVSQDEVLTNFTYRQEDETLTISEIIDGETQQVNLDMKQITTVLTLLLNVQLSHVRA